MNSPKNILFVFLAILVLAGVGYLVATKAKPAPTSLQTPAVQNQEGQTVTEKTPEQTKSELENDSKKAIPEDPKADIDQELNSLDTIIKDANPDDFGEDKLSDLEL